MVSNEWYGSLLLKIRTSEILDSTTFVMCSCRYVFVSLKPQVLEHSESGESIILLGSGEWQSVDDHEAER